jgi:hypothetical protein
MNPQDEPIRACPHCGRSEKIPSTHCAWCGQPMPDGPLAESHKPGGPSLPGRRPALDVLEFVASAVILGGVGYAFWTRIYLGLLVGIPMGCLLLVYSARSGRQSYLFKLGMLLVLPVLVPMALVFLLKLCTSGAR